MSKLRHDTELAAEREYVAFLYGQLDSERAAARAELDTALRNSSGTHPEAHVLREVAVATLSERVRRAGVADSGLCFGRLATTDGEQTYVGRIGLFDHEYEPLLLDWRAPAARPFYCATGANPLGIRVRRHFRTRARTIVDFHDDVLDSDGPLTADDTDAALLAALNAPRDETMRDIVATIRGEQDDIIRLPHQGVLVIEGGPGTGKTVVALHRVAYLLYTQRERMSRRGVLVVGPNPVFLHHIGQVLPSLGETDVVFATTGDLVPGLHVTQDDTPAARRVKGGIAMVDVLTAAIADRQELPAERVDIELDDVVVRLDARATAAARDRARATRLRHNEARGVFRDTVHTALAQRAVRQITASWLRPGEAPEVRAELTENVLAELRAHAELTATLDRLWPELTPKRLLADLFTSQQRIDAAATALSCADRAALHRLVGADWTTSDVPLLDEAAEQLGRDDTVRRQRGRRAKAERVAYAKGVLQVLDTDDEDGETLRVVDLLDEDRLADRHTERDDRALAERAAADREWTYGHIVVDEAQELSEMDWRVLARRCPSRSFTVVGDLAQRQSPAGATHWADMLDRYVPGRWAYRPLTVNYRMPSEIMAVAARVLTAMHPAARPPASVRSTGVPPWAMRVTEAELAATVADIAAREAVIVGEGTVAVIAPDGLGLGITPQAAKGLEFDSVVVVQPQDIWSTPDSGPAQLYVALTRATQRLGFVHTAPLPEVLTADGPQ
ncbi:MAG TPA: UvrD-helicase domain-containing protein [Pseudonocardiaceae bacterium]|nr:UvrD-helicase domain-containing protein [Pseudonocardiaceae bacterium]